MESRRSFLKSLGAGMAGTALAARASQIESQPASHPSFGLSAAEIPQTELGRTGLNVSRIGIGAGGVNRQNMNVLRAALARGVNYIDTSSGYGNGASETAVGEVIKSFGREKVIVQTKATGAAIRKGMSVAEMEEKIRAKLEESLKRLQTDYVDIYMCPHGASDPESLALPELREVVDNLKKEGKIRFFGVSTHNNYARCTDAAIRSGWHDVVMPSMSMGTFDAELLAFASQPQAQAASDDEPPQERRSRRKIIFEDLTATAKRAMESKIGFVSMKGALYITNAPGMFEIVKSRYPEAAKEYSPFQICFRWMYEQTFCHSVMIGLSSMQHLEEALALPSVQLM